MSMSSFQIPLNRGGEDYQTDETVLVEDYRGEPLAEVSQAPDIVLTYDALDNTPDAFEQLQDVVIDDLIDIFSAVGDYFTGSGYGEWVENIVRATGRTRTSAETAGAQLEQSMKRMGEYLEAQVPGSDLEVLDDNFYRRSDSERVDFIPVARNVGVVSPSNHPVVQVLPLMGLAAKIPLIHRPSNEEPFTAHRITESFYEAGLPEDSLYLLPGSKEFGHQVITSTDRGIIFGSDRVLDRYSDNPAVKTYGPGNSKMIIGLGYEDSSQALASAERGMMSDGGRGCINESQFILFGESEDFAYHLARRAIDAEIRDPLDRRAEVPAFDPDTADQMDSFIKKHLDQDGIRDITAEMVPNRIIERDGVTYLRPTVLHIDYDEFQDGTHPLFTELPFQYGAVTEVPPEDMNHVIEDSLSVSVHTDDQDVVDSLRLEPSVDKVHVDESSCNLDPSKPHEGYLIDYLYKEKEFSRAGA